MTLCSPGFASWSNKELMNVEHKIPFFASYGTLMGRHVLDFIECHTHCIAHRLPVTGFSCKAMQLNEVSDKGENF